MWINTHLHSEVNSALAARLSALSQKKARRVRFECFNTFMSTGRRLGDGCFYANKNAKLWGVMYGSHFRLPTVQPEVILYQGSQRNVKQGRSHKVGIFMGAENTMRWRLNLHTCRIFMETKTCCRQCYVFIEEGKLAVMLSASLAIFQSTHEKLVKQHSS